MSTCVNCNISLRNRCVLIIEGVEILEKECFSLICRKSISMLLKTIRLRFLFKFYILDKFPMKEIIIL
jgi:hypothetical protein